MANGNLSQAGNGFNLLGNPTTAYINSATFLSNNSGSLDTQTIWVWNQATDSYDTKVTADNFLIAPTQGFFVKAGAGTTNYSFNANQTSHSSTDTFQRGVSQKTVVELFVSNDNTSRYAKMYYTDEATNSFDNGFDGELFGGASHEFAVFSDLLNNSNGKKYQVQSVSKTGLESHIIPIGLIASKGKEINFSVKAKALPTGIKVFLEDKENGKITRLDDGGSYSFTTIKDINESGRFYLHTKSNAVLNTDDLLKGNIQIYSNGINSLAIDGVKNGQTTIVLFDVLGKEVFSSNFIAKGKNLVAIPNLTSGIYIVSVTNKGNVITKKIAVK